MLVLLYFDLLDSRLRQHDPALTSRRRDPQGGEPRYR
jgi:hypothetical protein